MIYKNSLFLFCHQNPVSLNPSYYFSLVSCCPLVKERRQALRFSSRRTKNNSPKFHDDNQVLSYKEI